MHGGGYLSGSAYGYRPLVGALTLAAGATALVPEYGLAPEHPFPAAVDDALAAFRGAAADAERLGLDPTRLGVAGDSAGGNLSAVVARRTRGEAQRPALTGLIYAAVDATRSSPSHRTFGARYLLTASMIDWYLGHYTDPSHHRDPDVSPLLAEEVGGVGPTLVYTAHFDPLRDEAEAYARRLSDAGVEAKVRRFPNLVHGFVVLGGASRAADAATDEIALELGATLRR